jgi:hypothetical protein
MFYAAYHIGLINLPKRKKELDEMMKSVGLDPDIKCSNTSTPEGLGIIAAKNVIEAWLKDGMNQLGEMWTRNKKRKYHRLPYFDYTGYVPVNTAYKIKDPNRWQPNIETQKNGIFTVQQFVTPQFGLVNPTTYKDVNYYKIP